MTTLSLGIEIDNARLLRALRASPRLLQKNMSRAILRIVHTLARTAKTGAPKAFSTLANSIQAELVHALYGRVFAGVDYAGYVEGGTEGTGNMPPVDQILAWIRVKHIQPADPRMTERNLAWAIATSIAAKGTPAQPFFQPSIDRHRTEASIRVRDAIDRTLQGMAV